MRKILTPSCIANFLDWFWLRLMRIIWGIIHLMRKWFSTCLIRHKPQCINPVYPAPSQPSKQSKTCPNPKIFPHQEKSNQPKQFANPSERNLRKWELNSKQQSPIKDHKTSSMILGSLLSKWTAIKRRSNTSIWRFKNLQISI